MSYPNSILFVSTVVLLLVMIPSITIALKTSIKNSLKNVVSSTLLYKLLIVRGYSTDDPYEGHPGNN